MIASLEMPAEGLIRCHAEARFDSSRRICLPPRKRRVGYVFQECSLFPHLTLYGNAAFAAADLH
jgi:molybdate transport system ATP-binding protein